MSESAYQSRLIKKIKTLIPGATVLKNESFNHQGFPDLLILKGNKWAALEVKASEGAHKQPNQDWWIGEINRSGAYAAFIFPENEPDILMCLLEYFDLFEYSNG